MPETENHQRYLHDSDLLTQHYNKSLLLPGVTPKFLQKDSLESIQEKCLDEVLGISKKRLLSIINDTKCPTDTESSDDDIQDIVEHISLDEISSDDESSKKTSTAAKSNSKKKSNNKVKEEPTTAPAGEKKEYSVLELLELQARARAIRSQLALEPVTKIELDEDDSPATEQKDNNKVTHTPDERSTPKKKKEKKVEKKTKEIPSKSRESNGKSPVKKRRSPIRSLAAGESSSATRPVKIKRNFRKQLSETDNSNNVEIKKELLENIAEKPREAGDSSPEVMTILASPVTLCISSDDDEGKAEPTSENLPQDEDPSKTSPEPPEEGEIEDVMEHSPGAKVSPDDEPKIVQLKDVAHDDPPLDNAIEVIESISKERPEMQREEETPSTGLEQSKDDADILCVQLDDDCIELECTDPIEEEQVTQETSRAREVVEIVDSSADEGEAEQDSTSNDTKSWGERWLGSSKVSKILATSKLGNQVRRRIKMSKQREKLESTEEATKSPPTDEGKPKEDDSQRGAEEGSIDHFKNIFDKTNTKAI